uniref:CST complex subunit TEN1 n=1 Tax=Glycine max TaxID=3847 RepID=A0A0R0KNS7_SOYBN
MASLEIKSGALVSLQDLRPSSPFFEQGASLRITGKLHEYSIETGLATIIDGDDILKVSTKHLRDLTFQVGSVYQFISELLIQAVMRYGVLQARVGRNVDGIDLNLYHQSLLFLRQFQANHLNNPATA